MSSRLGRRTSSPSSSSERSSAQPVSACRASTGFEVVISSSPSAPALASRPGGSSGGPPLPATLKRDRGRPPLAVAELVRAPLGDDPAGGDDRDAVGEPLRLVHVVRGQEDALAQSLEVRDHVPGLAAGRGVEPGRRLVEEEQLGVADQGHPDVEPAQLAAGEGAPRGHRPCGRARRARSSRRRQAGRGSSRRRARASRARSARGACGIAGARSRSARASRGWARPGRRRARSRRPSCARGSPRAPRRSSSSGAVGAEEREHLAGADLEVDPPHRLELAVGLAEPLDADRRRAHGCGILGRCSRGARTGRYPRPPGRSRRFEAARERALGVRARRRRGPRAHPPAAAG